MYGEWWEKHAHTNIFLAHCGFQGTILRQIQAPRLVSRERAESCLSIVRRMNAKQRYHQWGQLTHFYCTIARRRPPSPFRQSRVLRFPCGREEIMGISHYTISTRSQSLTVVERTISDLRA